MQPLLKLEGNLPTKREKKMENFAHAIHEQPATKLIGKIESLA